MMLVVAASIMPFSALLPPSQPSITRRAVIASAATSPLSMCFPANAASSLSTLKADSREERIEKQEERELLAEMRKIKKEEEIEKAELRRIRAAQKDVLALATNMESPDKLQMRLEEETKAVEADERELAFIREQYNENMVKLRAKEAEVAYERSDVIRSRPTSAMDRLRMKQ